MQIVFDVIDNLSSEPLRGATIAINGRAVGQTDSNGIYIADISESDIVTVSYVGYQPANVNGGILESTAQVQLSAATQILESVTVTPSSNKSSALLPILIAGGVVLAGTDKTRGVGKVNKTALYLGAGALGLGAVYLLSRPKTTAPIYSPPLVRPTGSSAQGLVSNSSLLNNISSLLPSGGAGGILDSIKNLFSGSSSSNPYDTQPVNYYSGYTPSPAAQAPTYVNPGSALQLDFSGAGMNGLGAIDLTSPVTLGILALGTYALVKSRKKKVGKVEVEKFIIPAGVVIGGYLILKNFNLLGGGAGSANAQSIQDAGSAGVAASIQAEKAAGGFTTISDAQAAGIANSIYNAGVSDPVDQDTISRGLIEANTTLDLYSIIKAFGTKQAGGLACSIFGNIMSSTCATYDLRSWIRATLDSYHINLVNGYLSDQSINYQF